MQDSRETCWFLLGKNYSAEPAQVLAFISFEAKSLLGMCLYHFVRWEKKERENKIFLGQNLIILDSYLYMK